MEASKTRKISTSALARSLELPVKDLFVKLEQAGWIERHNDNWALTDKGRQEGGEYTTHVKFGTYIVWPELVATPGEEKDEARAADYRALTASQIGERNHLSGRQINLMFAELGWIRRADDGWQVTSHGKRAGGLQKAHSRHNTPYVCWPEQVLHNPNVVMSLKDVKADLSHAIGLDEQVDRQSYPAKLRAADGHMLRSKPS